MFRTPTGNQARETNMSIYMPDGFGTRKNTLFYMPDGFGTRRNTSLYMPDGLGTRKNRMVSRHVKTRYSICRMA